MTDALRQKTDEAGARTPPLGADCPICENSSSSSCTAMPTQRIPNATAERFAAVQVLTDAFCEKHLNDEYRGLVRRLLGSLARKRPSPLLYGKVNVWAAVAVHAIGRTNFLDDPSQVPHCKSKVIFEFFGAGESTVIGKSKLIRKMLRMRPLSPEWTLPSHLADNPMVWMLQVNGLLLDIRDAPIEAQRVAYEKGLIPWIPAERGGKVSP
jgi:hypothetical protein